MEEQLLNDILSGGPNLDKALQKIQSDPNLAKYLVDLQAQQKAGQNAEKVAAAMRVLQNLGFTLGALSQIAKADRGVGQIQPPSIPQGPGSSPELAQALYEAKRGTVDPYATLNPAKQGIQEAYTSALNNAQTMSGGQAGAYQSLAQLANIERMRASLGLAPLAQQAKLQNQQVYNDLLAQKMQERQNQFNNSMGATQLAMDQYDRDAAAIGGLGSAGRTNLANSSMALGDSLQQAAPYFMKPQYRPFDEATNKYMDSVKQENAGWLSGVKRGWNKMTGNYLGPNYGQDGY